MSPCVVLWSDFFLCQGLLLLNLVDRWFDKRYISIWFEFQECKVAHWAFKCESQPVLPNCVLRCPRVSWAVPGSQGSPRSLRFSRGVPTMIRFSRGVPTMIRLCGGSQRNSVPLCRSALELFDPWRWKRIHKFHSWFKQQNTTFALSYLKRIFTWILPTLDTCFSMTENVWNQSSSIFPT